MPLPEKAIEQLGREPPRTPGWSGQLLIFSSTVLFISVLIYVGLVFGYQTYLKSQVKKIQDQIQVFSQQIPADEQAKIASFYSQLTNLKLLLANHVVSSRAFGWLEKNTQANVYWSSFNLNVDAGSLAINGVAKSIDDLEQQLAIFQSLSEIKKMNIGSISHSSSASASSSWSFGVTLFFPRGYFYVSNSQSEQ
jgi:hypothetical protein